jgi:hypothetical protein
LDVDKAEAMAMMIAGIADFNFDMYIVTTLFTVIFHAF